MNCLHLLAAAAVEAEADGVVEVAKQLEKQVIEDKEKEEEGEEGKHLNVEYANKHLTVCCDTVRHIYTFHWADGDDGENAAGKKKKKKKKKKGCKTSNSLISRRFKSRKIKAAVSFYWCFHPFKCLAKILI